MARNRKAEADRRNAAARAEGWDSYGQKYRARKANYTEPAAYRAAVAASKGAKPSKLAATGNLLGYTGTRAGVVIAAEWPDQARDQWRELYRYGKTRRLGLVIETSDGVINRSGRGGYSMRYVKEQVKLYALGRPQWHGWKEFVEDIAEKAMEQSYKGREIDEDESADDWIEIVTATVT